MHSGADEKNVAMIAAISIIINPVSGKRFPRRTAHDSTRPIYML